MKLFRGQEGLIKAIAYFEIMRDTSQNLEAYLEKLAENILLNSNNLIA